MLRRPLILIALALLAGLLGYGITRLAMRPPQPEIASSPEAQLAWLAREFSLSRSAGEEIARLQTAYEPICEAHCTAIARAQAALSLARHSQDSAGIAAAEAELARLKRVCADATRAHLEAVAAQMQPAQAARFLALMEPRIAHTGPREGAPALAPSLVDQP